MKTVEKIPVYVRIINGRTVCICKQDQKRCKMPCPRDNVTRDRYNGWQKIFLTVLSDKFGMHEQMNEQWKEVNKLTEEIKENRVTIVDLVEAFEDEYGIEISNLGKK